MADTNDRNSDKRCRKTPRGETVPGIARASGRKRILIISPWASRWSLGSGAGVSDDYYFIEKFTKSGYEIHLLTPRPGTPSDIPFENVFVHTYPNFFRATEGWPTAFKRVLWPALFNTVVTARVLTLGRRIKPDFVLGHSHYGSFPSYMARELLGVPSGVKLFGVMDLVHSEWPRGKYYLRNLEQITALKIPQDVWIILDDGTQGRQAALRHGVPDEKIRFLPNGVNVEWSERDLDRDHIREEMGIPRDTVVVLFLARLVASKRPELLLHAIPDVRRRCARGVLFLFVGDGPSRNSCERLAQSLELGDVVRFAGAVEHGRVPEVMSASDIFVSTSRLTNVAIPTCEAMVCGLPVVGFDVGDARAVIRDGETGYVVPDGDVEALSRAITKLIEDSAARGRMAHVSKSRAREVFTSWEERTRMELEIIDGFIDR